MRRFSLLIILMLLPLVGCGHYENSIYDTAGNPSGFPAMACDLLDRFDSRQLTTSDQITEGFNQLYTEHSELFENSQWREIITRLGPIFAERADSLASEGPSAFSAAAGFYILASMATPDNPEARERSLLFDAWLRGLDEMGVDDTLPGFLSTPAEALHIVRYLLLGDSLQQRFARMYLVNDPLDSLLAQGSDGMTVADKAFLVYAGLCEMDLDAPLAVFGGPKIELLASRLAIGPGDKLRLELYFRADAKVEGDYQLALKGAHPIDEQVVVAPQSPASDWQPGAIVLITTPVEYVDPQDGLALALKLLDGKRAVYAPVEGQEQPFVALPPMVE